ncbi:hypothetical protein [Lentzea sp. NBRC 102530]|uniref:hypothetical protein n=1 Tax=Lentzea sp. NBRC 102530 TaxID=3032201 RepID=UPI0024A14A1E|nr:hypothetical protein [Lentzea sp. NBRC 102530]GLY47709.1 hypothetical protein Lesp01_13650 [Lentzea sp. NBRC 102530]
MPNLDFFAAGDDWTAVLETVFGLGVFRVFESDSEPGTELREFRSAAEAAGDQRAWHLSLFVDGAGPEPLRSRIDFLPGVSPEAPFRYTCEGWGLIQLDRGRVDGVRELGWSHTNHNSEKRASAWAATNPELGDPAEWDWAAVTSASGRLNRAIRRRAVDKIGSRPVLPHAQRFIAEAGLRFVYGTGIHSTTV